MRGDTVRPQDAVLPDHHAAGDIAVCPYPGIVTDDDIPVGLMGFVPEMEDPLMPLRPDMHTVTDGTPPADDNGCTLSAVDKGVAADVAVLPDPNSPLTIDKGMIPDLNRRMQVAPLAYKVCHVPVVMLACYLEEQPDDPVRSASHRLWW